MTDRADTLQRLLRRNIKVLMALDGTTARELARRIGQSENWLSQKQSGRRRWHLDDLPAVADALGVEAWDLLRDVSHAVQVAESATGTDGSRQRPAPVRANERTDADLTGGPKVGKFDGKVLYSARTVGRWFTNQQVDAVRAGAAS